MPNWCQTYIHFYSDDPNLLKDYQERLQEVYDAQATVENGFGGGWLGDFVNTLLAPEFNTESENFDLRCRGNLDDAPCADEIHFDEGNRIYNFAISTETAWAPMIQMWDLILKKYYGDKIKLAFTAEESGMGVYENYDPEGLFGFSNFILDTCVEGEYDREYFYDFESLIDYLCDTLCDVESLGVTEEQLESKTTAKELAKFLNELSEKLPEGDYLYFEEYTEFTGLFEEL
ncbi:MAG: hypothetical protein FWD58_06250 [Firmicutes bacterium]|nr:hypothetical protein [Bacillota bacterium]